MAINLAKEEKAAIIKKFGKDANDSGSAEVQIALLTQKITELTEHLKINKKDFQGRRGLLMMVGQRKRLLAYVKKQDLQKYRDLIKELGIRG
jgi:small subunit ribosomal protein S15